MNVKTQLPVINFALLVVLSVFVALNYIKKQNNSFEELKAERLSIVGSDGNLYISISNPEKQAVATIHGQPIDPESTQRDLPGIIFFNRVGDEIGGIFYDGTDTTSSQGITFDQQKNDQVLAIMKDEYLEGDEWKRWYGMFLRERSDSVRVEELYNNFVQRTKSMSRENKQKEYLQFKKYLDEKINVYRMFLGREENKEVGLFLFDSKGRKRIKLYIDGEDNAILEVTDTLGNSFNLLNKNKF